MSLLRNCLTKLVGNGSITEQVAKDALGIAEGVQGRLYPQMPPASAEAASALQAAQAMVKAAKQRKLHVAKQAISMARARERMQRHSQGPVHGLISMMTRDVWEDGANTGLSQLHVEGHTEAVLGDLMRRGGKFFDPLQPGVLGLRQDNQVITNTIAELFGESTGDEVAGAAAKAFNEMNDAAVKRLQQNGVMGNQLDDWRLPQRWDSARVAKFGEQEFHRDMMEAIEAGKIKVRDKKSPDGYAPRAAISGIVLQNYKNHVIGRGSGHSGSSLQQFRVFEFEDAATYRKLMDKYGPGPGGLYGMMTGHAQAMAREIALVEMFGPAYRSSFKKLHQEAEQRYNKQKHDASGAEKAGLILKSNVLGATPRAAQRMFDWVAGDLSAVESDSLAGLFGGLRNLATASRLGSAFVSAVPGDMVTASLAANYNGLPAAKVIGRAVADMVSAADRDELASQMNLVSNAMLDSAIMSKRFEDGVEGSGVTAKLAQAVIRVQGLQAWTEAMKRSFSMEFMGMIGRQTDRTFNSLEPDFKRFLKRYGFSAAEWDELRQTPNILADGARFFDPAGMQNRELADRLSSAIIDERGFAIVESNARVRQMTTAGRRRGTVTGEMARSFFLFKSFTMTILTTHMMRNFTQGTMAARAGRMASYITLMTMAGAVSFQAKSLLTGKDPADMTKPEFWGAAFAAGGGAGIYADLFFSAQSRGNLGVYEMVAGPVFQPPISAFSMLAGGKKVTGKGLVDLVAAYTPGSTLWYTRAAVDRLLFDQVNRLVDPDWDKSNRRHEKRILKDFGQDYFWRRGDAAPSRGPDLSNAVGG
ncbi:MAG: hypothetical protein AAGI12_08080 [Pseudomonadota bacterium]